MGGEGKHSDYKRDFDPENARQKLDLAKNLVAMANSNGGQIVIGRDETESLGVSKKAASSLDSAKITDLVENWVAPAHVEIAHALETLKSGKLIVTLAIEGVDVPLVMAKDGVWKGFDSGKDKPLFFRGDVWIRHSSKTERISYEDLRAWILRVRQAERNQVLDRVSTLVNLPENSAIEVVSPSGLAIDSPKRLLESVARRRERDPNHLLSADDLLWIFVQRDGLKLLESDLEVLIASSLRRSATLFWWLAEADNNPDLVKQVLLETLVAADRDKSDAANRITEVGAVYTDSSTSQRLVKSLKDSDYKHFRTAGEDWPGKRQAKREFSERVSEAKYQGQVLLELSIEELEGLASGLAEELLREKKSAISRKLADVNRTIWARKSKHSGFVSTP